MRLTGDWSNLLDQLADNEIGFIEWRADRTGRRFGVGRRRRWRATVRHEP